MKKLIAISIGLGLVLGTVSFAQDKKDEPKKEEKKGKKGKKKDAEKAPAAK